MGKRYTINQLPTLRRRLAKVHPEPGGTLAPDPSEKPGVYDWAQKMSLATLFWVTADMTKVAMDAALDVPEIVEPDRPTPAGLLVFEQPLPPLPLDNDPLSQYTTEKMVGRDHRFQDYTRDLIAPLPVDGIQWYSQGGFTTVSAFSFTYRYIELGGDPTYPAPVVFLSDLPLKIGETTDLEREMHWRPTEVRAFAALVEAIWVLMMTPTAASRTLIDAGTGREPAGYTPPSTREVTRIDLRPLRQVATEPADTDSRGRVYRHRWIVRGHWRNQAQGPGRSQRKITWIPSYIKGPPGAPILATEKVMVWRR